MQARFDRSNRCPRPFRNRVEWKVEEIAQDDHDPVVRAQIPDCLPQRLAFASVPELVCRRVNHEPANGRGPSSPKSVAADVDEDSAEPCAGVLGVPELAPVLPRANQRFLDRVLRLGMVTQDDRGSSVGGRELSCDQVRERGLPIPRVVDWHYCTVGHDLRFVECLPDLSTRRSGLRVGSNKLARWRTKAPDHYLLRGPNRRGGGGHGKEHDDCDRDVGHRSSSALDPDGVPLGSLSVANVT